MPTNMDLLNVWGSMGDMTTLQQRAGGFGAEAEPLQVREHASQEPVLTWAGCLCSCVHLRSHLCKSVWIAVPYRCHNVEFTRPHKRTSVSCDPFGSNWQPFVPICDSCAYPCGFQIHFCRDILVLPLQKYFSTDSMDTFPA